jgi:tetratricopeptide (TPR) repeat protein
MRLLTLDSHGELSLIDSNGSLDYAILSHRWGAPGDEVTYKDLVECIGKDMTDYNTIRDKPGYAKVKFCVEQAARDGLQYSWVDTCCIDKSNAVELSEAINSMFRWYNNAAKCYVFLNDVSLGEMDIESPASQMEWEVAFQSSKWFARGWTLQELIAPSSVEFFSIEGLRLGNKRSLERYVQEVTGIALQALRGGPLSQFDFYERMSWAAKRETTKEEDAAYSLLGIFEVSMPLIYGEGRKRALARLHSVFKELSDPGSLPPSLQDATAHWIVPFEKNPDFTGRNVELSDLKKKLFVADGTTKTIAITGLGGVGKTQLALELIHQVKDMHRSCSVIWIPATNLDSLYQAYVDTARQLGISGWEDGKSDVKKLVQEYLSKDSTGTWILVFDNADDIVMWTSELDADVEQDSDCLADYLPKSKRGHIIFTTRDKKVAVELAGKNIVEVHEMSTDTALELLQNYLTDKNLISSSLQEAKSLLGKLTHLPLAIVQAASYINKNGISLADYLSLLAEQEEDVVDLLSEQFRDNWRYRNIKNPVAVTWLVSFKQIQQRDPLAADYLSFIACVEPKDIPQSLLPPGPSRKKEMDALGTLSAYSFISKRPVDVALDLHRLVHLATRNWLRKERLLSEWMEKAILRLEEVFPSDDHTNRSVWRMYLPHTRQVLKSDLVSKDGESRLALLWRYARCLYSDGRWNEAEATFNEIVAIEMKNPDIDHPDRLNSIAWMAGTFRNQGRWEEAELLEVQVMETRKTKLGADHPSTLTSMANLASTYRNQGRWEEAELLEVQVMETRKTKLGADHPDTLTTMNNLAFTWKGQGKDAEALQLMEDCVQRRKRVLGAQHPHFLSSHATLRKWEAEQSDVMN